jgi:glutamate dehydrogenase (NADP+)
MELRSISQLDTLFVAFSSSSYMPPKNTPSVLLIPLLTPILLPALAILSRTCRREGDARFKTGSEATEMLIQEAKRKDPHAMQFLDTLDEIIPTLAPLLDRAPKYAWIAKQLLEPERVVQFRVSWLDDNGNSRINRGWRVQYSSSLGPYEGGLNFSGSITSGVVKALGLESVFINSLTGCNLGAAAGGADFNPHNKSEAEIQRFCQSYMTELSKYIGPDHDYPSMGFGVGINEIGYLYGQWKRMNSHLAQRGSGILWGGLNPYPQAVGHGIVHFAEAMLNGKKESLKGKRCLVTGSGKVALHVAEKLLEYGAIPLSFTDQSGHIYEPEVRGGGARRRRLWSRPASVNLERHPPRFSHATLVSFPHPGL